MLIHAPVFSRGNFAFSIQYSRSRPHLWCVCRRRSNNAARRAADSRPYGEDGKFARKTAVCGVQPLFRGSSCGLSENPCSRRPSDSTGPREAGKGWAVWGGTARWSVTARAMPLLGMHAAGSSGGPGAAAPGAFWGLFRGEKSPAGGWRKTASAQTPPRLLRPLRLPEALKQRGQAGG